MLSQQRWGIDTLSAARARCNSERGGGGPSQDAAGSEVLALPVSRTAAECDAQVGRRGAALEILLETVLYDSTFHMAFIELVLCFSESGCGFERDVFGRCDQLEVLLETWQAPPLQFLTLVGLGLLDGPYCFH